MSKHQLDCIQMDWTTNDPWFLRSACMNRPAAWMHGNSKSGKGKKEKCKRDPWLYWNVLTLNNRATTVGWPNYLSYKSFIGSWVFYDNKQNSETAPRQPSSSDHLGASWPQRAPPYDPLRRFGFQRETKSRRRIPGYPFLFTCLKRPSTSSANLTIDSLSELNCFCTPESDGKWKQRENQ